MTNCTLHTLIADVCLIHDGKVLLVKYTDTNKYDHQSGWFLPDDALHHLEHPQDAARRILKEQLGLSVHDLKLNHIESFKGNDGSWHLAFHYRVVLTAKPGLEPSSDISEAEWFSVPDGTAVPDGAAVDALPPKNEFAHHGWGHTVIKAVLKEIS